MRCERVGSGKAVGGYEYDTAREGETCKTEQVSEQKVWSLATEGCTKMRAY